MLKIRRLGRWVIRYPGFSHEMNTLLRTPMGFEGGVSLSLGDVLFEDKGFALRTAKSLLEKFKAEHPVIIHDTFGVKLSKADRRLAENQISGEGQRKAQIRYTAGEIAPITKAAFVLRRTMEARLLRIQDVTATVSVEGQTYTRAYQDIYFSSWYPVQVAGDKDIRLDVNTFEEILAVEVADAKA